MSFRCMLCRLLYLITLYGKWSYLIPTYNCTLQKVFQENSLSYTEEGNRIEEGNYYIEREREKEK